MNIVDTLRSANPPSVYIATQAATEIDRLRTLVTSIQEAVWSDLEHVVKCLNEKAAQDFKTNYPALFQILEHANSGQEA